MRKTVNEMSNFMYTGQVGNFIFHPVSLVQFYPATCARVAYSSWSDRSMQVYVAYPCFRATSLQTKTIRERLGMKLPH